MRRTAGYTLSDCKRNEGIMKELHITTNNRIYRKIQKKVERACWKDECR
jgi:hypothetical protein